MILCRIICETLYITRFAVFVLYPSRALVLCDYSLLATRPLALRCVRGFVPGSRARDASIFPSVYRRGAPEVFQQAKPRFANTVGVPGVPEVFQRFLQAKPRFANT